MVEIPYTQAYLTCMFPHKQHWGERMPDQKQKRKQMKSYWSNSSFFFLFFQNL